MGNSSNSECAWGCRRALRIAVIGIVLAHVFIACSPSERNKQLQEEQVVDPKHQAPRATDTSKDLVLADSLALIAAALPFSDTTKAVEAYRRAAQIYLALGAEHTGQVLECWANICLLTKRTAMADTAWRYAQLSDSLLQGCSRSLSDSTASFVFRHISLPLLDGKRRDAGVSYAIKSVDRAVRSKDLEAIDWSKDNLAEAYTAVGGYEENVEAIRLEREFIASAITRYTVNGVLSMRGHDQLADAHSAIAKAYKNIGQPDSSLYHMRKAYQEERLSSGSSTQTWSDYETNIANAFLYVGFAGNPSGFDSCIHYVELAERSMAQNEPLLVDRLSRALALKALVQQIQGRHDQALVTASNCPRPWIADRSGNKPVDWRSAEAPTLAELDSWCCVVENMFTEFKDTSTIGWAKALNEEILRGQRAMAGDIDPGSLERAYRERGMHNNRYLNYLWQTRADGIEWAPLVQLFEARKADQMRNWLNTIEQVGGNGSGKATYQSLLGQRALLNDQLKSTKNIEAIARVSNAIDSIGRTLRLDQDAAAGTGSGDLLAETFNALDDSTLLINYAWADDANGAKLNIIALSRQERIFVQRQIKPWLDSLLSVHVNSVENDGYQTSSASATALGDSLLPTILVSGRYTNVIVIPDGPLNKLPFETLGVRSRSGVSSLMDVAKVRYEYGMGFIGHDEHRGSGEGTLVCAPIFKGKALVPAPENDRRSLLTAEPSLLRSGIAPLTENTVEATVLRDFYGATAYLGGDATEGGVSAALSGFNVLHFATHAICSDSLPELSGVLLSGALSENSNAPLSERSTNVAGSTDNILHAYEIRALRLKADLVVLSACETGLGKELVGEGAMSLARAFRFAGAKSIVSSLWKVDDRATKEIMVKFYEKLAEGMGKADALAEAKRWYRKENPNAPPSHWAAFILIGDNEPVQLKKRSPVWPWMIGGGAIAAVVAAMAARRRRHRAKAA